MIYFYLLLLSQSCTKMSVLSLQSTKNIWPQMQIPSLNFKTFLNIRIKTTSKPKQLLQLWSPRIMFLYGFLKDNEWEFDSYFTFEAKQALRSCFRIQLDKLKCSVCTKNCFYDTNSSNCSKCFVLFHNKCINLQRSRKTWKCVNC